MGSTRRPLVALLVVVVLVGVLTALLFRFRKQPKPEMPSVQVETPRSELVQNDGRWYRIGQTNPFTGWMADLDPNGARLSHWQVSNGLLNGLSETWYTNGQIQVREFYRTNYSNGLRTKWYPSGHRLSEAAIVLGKMEGTFRRWYEDGKLAEEIPMRDGKIEGTGRTYYESGFLKSEVTLHDGKQVTASSWLDGQQSGPGQ